MGITLEVERLDSPVAVHTTKYKRKAVLSFLTWFPLSAATQPLRRVNKETFSTGKRRECEQPKILWTCYLYSQGRQRQGWAPSAHLFHADTTHKWTLRPPTLNPFAKAPCIGYTRTRSILGIDTRRYLDDMQSNEAISFSSLVFCTRRPSISDSI